MNLLKSLLTSGPALGIALGLLLTLIGIAVKKAVTFFAARPKLQPLEPLAEDAGKVLDDAAKTAEADLVAGKSAAATALDAAKVALADAKADLPDAAEALKEEVSVLLNGVPTQAPTPGGAVVNLPTPKPRGLATLVVLLIIGGVALVGGLAALVATGNGSQALSCVEQAVNANPAGVGALVSGLSTNAEADIQSALTNLGPDIGKCVLTDLWTDAGAALARNAALKANAKAVAPVPAIQNAAQVECVKRGWFPAGALAGTTGGSTSSASSSTAGR